METEYLKGLNGNYSQNRGQGYRGNKKKIAGIRYLLEPYIVQTHPVVTPVPPLS